MTNVERDPAILGMLCTLQTSFHVLPTYEQLGAMVERGLEWVPGIAASHLAIDVAGPVASSDAGAAPAESTATILESAVDEDAHATKTISLPLRTAQSAYGQLELEVSDPERYEPYQPFVKNLLNSIATEIESRERARALEDARRKLAHEQHRLQRELRHKDDYIALLGHELRNPLAALQNAADLLNALNFTDILFDRARSVIARQVEHMTRMVDDLLDITRLKRDKMNLQMEPLDLGDLAREICADHHARIDDHGLELVVHLTDHAMPIEGDHTRLIQVLCNLLDNSIKFTDPPGTITICGYVDQESDRAVVCVSDTGQGIQQELMDTLFSPFWQQRDPRTEPQDGIGLGLALVQGIVNAHDGDVEVHSDGVGRGSSFCMSLPLVS